MRGTLGLAARSRKLVIGTELVIKSLQKQEVYLVLLSSDSSSNTKKMVTDKAKHYNIEVIEIDDVLLNQSIGKTNIKVVGISDFGFAQMLSSKKGM